MKDDAMNDKPRIVSYEKRPLTAKERAELDALAARPDSEIDTTDMPALDAEFFENGLVGAFGNPPIRIDRRVIEWFREHVGEHGTVAMDINHVLLDYIAAQKKA